MRHKVRFLSQGREERLPIPTVLRDIPVYQGWLPEGSGIWKARDAAGFRQAVGEALTCPLHDTNKAGRSIALSRRLESVGQSLAAIYQKEFLVPQNENNDQSKEVIS